MPCWYSHEDKIFRSCLLGKFCAYLCACVRVYMCVRWFSRKDRYRQGFRICGRVHVGVGVAGRASSFSFYLSLSFQIILVGQKDWAVRALEFRLVHITQASVVESFFLAQYKCIRLFQDQARLPYGVVVLSACMIRGN